MPFHFVSFCLVIRSPSNAYTEWECHLVWVPCVILCMCVYLVVCQFKAIFTIIIQKWSNISPSDTVCTKEGERGRVQTAIMHFSVLLTNCWKYQMKRCTHRQEFLFFHAQTEEKNKTKTQNSARSRIRIICCLKY